MLQLSKAAYKQAESFINTTARPLEAARFARVMGGASPDWILSELAAFQNMDGGFGHGLEPDLQIADSSVLATTVALQILRELKVSSSNSLVQGAMRFLLDTFDESVKAWPFIPPNSDDAPHAPWWQYDPDVSRFLTNPRVEIVGYFLDYADLVPENMGASLLTSVIDQLDTHHGEMEMHGLLCYVRLLDTESLPQKAHLALLNNLSPIVESSVARDASAWSQYGLKPLSVAPTPSSPFASILEQAIEDNLDYEIEQQLNDGSWAPAWSWGDSHPQAWPHAQRAWKGVLTVNTIQSLKAYGRIAS